MTAAANDAPVALITGASKRVGRAVAIDLATHGFDLILTWRSTRDKLEQTIRLARSASDREDIRIDIHQSDFSVADDVESLCESIGARPRLDAIVHNASSYAPSPLESLDEDDLLHHFRVNAMAPAALTRAAAPLLRASTLSGGGSVVCFSDIHVLGRPRRDHLAYSMSKAALTEMVHALAVDLAPQVRVNAIAPGVVAWPDDADEEEIRQYRKRIPLQRDGTPDDAAALVRWLILEASYVTGEVIRLDGGRWLR